VYPEQREVSVALNAADAPDLAGRLDCSGVIRDEGISGAPGRANWPGLDILC
jgi:hypothetical protein